MKKKRQQLIIDLISNNEIETQEELQKLLFENGYEVTQATVSRDIKELKLFKDVSSNGRYVYTNKNTKNDIVNDANGLFSHAIISVDYSLNFVCIKCYSGMAGAACAAIDSIDWNGVLGTIAGDDTIFVLCRNEEASKMFKESLEKSLNA